MFTKMKLGKLKPKYDRHTLQFSKYLTATIPYAPQISHWPNAAPLGMLMNDQIGDCTIAAALHNEMIWSKANGLIYKPVDADALQGYSAVSGYNPKTGENDNGCYCLDVLNYWRKTGIGGRTIEAFVQINPRNHMHVQHAAFFFGGLYIGISLPVSAQTQTYLWDVSALGLTGDGTPGSWGGHCINIAGYDQKGLDIITWGMRIRMTWAFWDAYVDECYAVVSNNFIVNADRAPNGFDKASLLQDLALVTA